MRLDKRKGWLLGIPLFALGCEARNQYVPPPPAKVTVAQPVVENVADYAEFTGTTRAVQTVQLRSRIDGYLKQIAFKDGSRVQAGDLLFVIEPEPFEVALRTALAAVDKAKASLQLAESILSRAERLRESNSIAGEEIDSRRAERNSAAAELQSAESAVERARLDLNYTKIVAPISGRINRHLIDVGNLVQVETTLLTTIETTDPIHVYFSISEGDYLRFMSLRRENIIPDPEKEAFKLKLRLPNETEFRREGVLDYLDLGVDPASGTLSRRAVFANPEMELVPGLFVHLRATLGAERPRVLVEDRAIATDQRGDYVLVVDAENSVEQRRVKLGAVHGEYRVVDEGLTQEDWVIINGLQRARPGNKVEPTRHQPSPVPIQEKK